MPKHTNKTFSSYRFKKLAGIITENIKENLTTEIKNVVQTWLKKGGESKIKSHLESKLFKWFEEGNHVDVDEDGPYSITPNFEDFSGELAEDFIEEIVDSADNKEFIEKYYDDPITTDKVYELVEILLNSYAKSVFNDVAADAIYDFNN